MRLKKFNVQGLIHRFFRPQSIYIIKEVDF